MLHGRLHVGIAQPAAAKCLLLRPPVFYSVHFYLAEVVLWIPIRQCGLVGRRNHGLARLFEYRRLERESATGLAHALHVDVIWRRQCLCHGAPVLLRRPVRDELVALKDQLRFLRILLI